MKINPGYYLDNNGELNSLAIDSDGFCNVHNLDDNSHIQCKGMPFKKFIFLGDVWANIPTELLRNNWRNFSKYNN